MSQIHVSNRKYVIVGYISPDTAAVAAIRAQIEPGDSLEVLVQEQAGE